MRITPFRRKKDESKTPQIILDKQAYQRLYNFMTLKNVEIMLLGIVKHDAETNIYLIEDFLPPPQTDNSSVFVTTADAEYAEWLQQMTREQRQALKCHFHTHPNMGTTPSGTDVTTINEKVENIDDFYIRMIGNTSGEFHIDLFLPQQQVKYEEMKAFVLTEDFNIILSKQGTEVRPKILDLTKELEDQMIVRKPVTNYPKYGYGYYGAKKETTPKTVEVTKTKTKKKTPTDLPLEEEAEDIYFAIQTGGYHKLDLKHDLDTGSLDFTDMYKDLELTVADINRIEKSYDMDFLSETIETWIYGEQV